jgi:adenine phosphoribosyltransferase
MNVLLCSESPLKTAAVKSFYSLQDVTITNFNCDELKLPAQPINSALQCAKLRLDYAKRYTNIKYDIYVSIENGIRADKYGYYEECCAIIDDGIMSNGYISFQIPQKYNIMIYNSIIDKYTNKLGHDVTFGEILQQENSTIDAKNWMLKICQYDRGKMIVDAMHNAICNRDYLKGLIDNVLKAYKSYPDFPKPGVLFQDRDVGRNDVNSFDSKSNELTSFLPTSLFQDIFAVLANGDAIDDLCTILQSRYSLDEVDYVVGLESRGFFGILLAKELKVGFIPIRKAGKLPGEVKQMAYGTEYSKDICEISTDIPKGSRVIVFDDLIATGGSLKAAVTLLESLDCVIVDLCVLREVVDLRDKAMVTLNRPYTVLLQ